MLTFPSVFHEVSAILAIAAAVGLAAMFLRQPLIISFIFTGILVGPSGLGMVSVADQVDLLAKLGITILLFIVGLRLNLHLIRTIGPVAVATGLGQVLFTSFTGYAIAILLGMPPIHALYVAVALTFSSTIIIVKLLSDKGEIDSLHGQIAIGFLIVQDLVVILVMIGLTALGRDEADSVSKGLVAIMKGGLFLGAVAAAMRYILPALLHRVAQSRELLLLFAIAWAVALAAVSDALGFSKEVGAFVAGVSLASTSYRFAIGTRLANMRDFLLLFFFIDLGTSIDTGLLGAQLTAAVVLSVFVLVGNPFIVLIIMSLMGYRTRTGFLAGLTVAQISEFSLLLGALGVSLGHLTRDVLGLITLVGLVTIGLSTYMILHSHRLYEILSPFLGLFERWSTDREELRPARAVEAEAEVVIFGLGRYGSDMAEELVKRGASVLGVDFDPEAVKKWNASGKLALYGDAEDMDLTEDLPVGKARWVVSAIPSLAANLALVNGLREHGFKGRIALSARLSHDVDALEKAGADVVLTPFRDAATEAVNIIEGADGTDTAGGAKH